MHLIKPILALLVAVPLKTQPRQVQDLNKMIINIELKNASLTEALNKIESLTTLKFNYKTDDLGGLTGITYKQQLVPVKKVLHDLFSNTPLHYEQVQCYILIKKKPVTRVQRKIRSQ